MNDPIADFLTRIRNAQTAGHRKVDVPASKLKRAQDAITQMRPYAEKLKDILSNLSASLDTSENVYSQDRDVKNVLIVVVTSNRGLCGGFNNYVIKKALKMAKNIALPIFP